MKYRLIGYDQFSDEEYDLPGEYVTLDLAREARDNRVKHTLETQYASPGFHDRTYIKNEAGKVVA